MPSVFQKIEKKVLLVRRRDIPVWVPPGGGVEPQESPEESVLREVTEESGYRAKIVRKVGFYTPLNRLSKRTHLFECEIIGGSAQTGPESRAVSFFPLDKLPKPLAPPHIEWIEDAAANKPHCIERPITCVTYWTLFKALIFHPKITLSFLLSRFGIHINR